MWDIETPTNEQMIHCQIGVMIMTEILTLLLQKGMVRAFLAYRYGTM